MPHRDDREAAHHRIEALERELAQTRERAERAEKATRETDDARTLERTRSREESRPEPPSAESRAWPSRDRGRFERGALLAVALLDAPVVVLLAGWRWDIDDGDSAILGWSLGPVLLLIPTVYVLARLCRAPFPSSAMMVSILASAVGWFGVVMAASDMLWGELLAEPPLRWVTRGAGGALAVALHALMVRQWCAEAALSDVGSGD